MNGATLKRLIPLGSTTIIYFLALLFGDLVLGVENRYFGGPVELWWLYWPTLNFNGSLLPDLA
ncbi:MAG: hypothetical protein DRR42_23395, partial [Gammaproteobacteria bacterium]